LAGNTGADHFAVLLLYAGEALLLSLSGQEGEEIIGTRGGGGSGSETAERASAMGLIGGVLSLRRGMVGLSGSSEIVF
jgi:hypothetical protein